MSRERSPIANVFRWLRIGRSYIYQAAKGKGDDARRGERCVVEIVPRPGGGPGNARVRLEDGHVVVVPAGVLRKV